jgi:4-alpha-glucanotransferase
MLNLESAAARWSVETGYHDARGQWRSPSPEALAEIVSALATVEPVPDPVVRRPGRDESGSPPGDERATLIAPPCAHQPQFAANRGVWLLAVQLYGVRSKRNWGIGDFTDVAGLLQLASDAGAAGIALNPLHALLYEQASPYSPNSRLHLNILAIDVERVPGFPGVEALGIGDELQRLRATELVDYAGVAAIKAAALRAAHARCRDLDAAERDDFAAFRAERGGALIRFAAFETLWARFRRPWWDWPEDYRTPSPALLDQLGADAADELDFHQFMQWQADRQLRDCRDLARRLALPIGLYLDIAVGVIPDGADAWGEQSALSRGLTIGAPPDVYNPAGQSWGLASFHPAALIRSDFSLLRETLRAAMRYAGAVRLDHVLGLNRLFVIPVGRDARDGTYVRFPLQAMLAVIAQESVAAKCLVIGEDLGTVPEGFREVMADWGLWSYRVGLFERRRDGAFHPPENYPEQALVTFNTHDLPTFAGWLAGHDLVVKQAIGVDPGENAEERESARRAVSEVLTRGGLGPEPVFPDVAQWLARTPSRLLVISAEDVLGVREQPNIPGTIDEHPNWRRKLPCNLEDLAADEHLRAIADALAAEGRSSRR